MDYISYLKNKCFIGYGVINGIINALIFYLINKNAMNTVFSFDKALFELALTALLLGLILTWCVVPLTKMDLRKGVFKPGTVCSFCSRLTPKALPLSLIVAVVSCVAGTLISIIVLCCLGSVIAAWTLLLVKGCVCALCGAVSGFMVIEAVTGQSR